MFDTILTALLPITVVLILGYLAGYHQDFSKDQAGVLNKMVMLYALPLSLFSSIATSSMSEILKEKEILLGLFIGMIVFYLVVYLITRFLFKQNSRLSALISLTIAGPAIPFVGVPVLGELYGSVSSIPIAVGSIYMNLFQVPLTIILLNLGVKNTDGTQTNSFVSNIINAVKQPVVWAPVLGLLFVLIDLKFPTALIDSFTLLGKSTGGVALFASGIILFSYKVVFNKSVLAIVLSKNILIPLAIWGVSLLLNFPSSVLKETVVTMSIPTASVVIMLAIQYEEGQQTISSALFLSSVLSILTMGFFIFLLS